MNSLTKRSTPRACSSITKAKMTSCVPSRGMSVSVDLASLGAVGEGHHSGPLSWPLLPVLCSRRPPRPGIWVTEPSPPNTLGQAAWRGGSKRWRPQKPRGCPGTGVRQDLGAQPGLGGGRQFSWGSKLRTPGPPSLPQGRAQGAQQGRLHYITCTWRLSCT